MTASGMFIPAIFCMFFFIFSSSVYATTLSEILTGIRDLRNPSTLNAMSLDAEVRMQNNTSQSIFVPLVFDFSSVWKSPDLFQIRWEIEGDDSVEAMYQSQASHPALDHVALSRPDMVDLLSFRFSITYQGTALWDGDPAYQLILRPSDLTSYFSEFNLIVRKSDFVPLRTIVTFDDGTSAVTDFEWLNVSGVLVPEKFTTTLNPPLNGYLTGFETTFMDYEINPDVSGIEFSGVSGTISTDVGDTGPVDDGGGAFEELYHGFTDQTIVAPVNDPSGTYAQLSFKFSLYVEEREVFFALDHNKAEIRELASSVISGWDWSADGALDDPSVKWYAGRAIMNAIGDFLDTEAITDFYFVEWVFG